MDAFFVAFWPNAAATFAGLVVGLPIALWVNRMALKGAAQAGLQGQKHRLDHGLQVLIVAMESNQSILQSYAQHVSESRGAWHLALDSSAWGAIQADFGAELTEPLFRRRIAHHFSQLAIMTGLNQTYLEFSFGTSASMSSAEQTRVSLAANVGRLCTELDQEARELIQLARSVRKDLASAEENSPHRNSATR